MEIFCKKKCQNVFFANSRKINQKPLTGFDRVLNTALFRSTRPEVFLKISQNSQETPVAESLFYRTPFFAEHLQWLLLYLTDYFYFKNFQKEL